MTEVTTCLRCGKVRECTVWIIGDLRTGEAREEAVCLVCAPPMTPAEFFARQPYPTGWSGATREG